MSKLNLSGDVPPPRSCPSFSTSNNYLYIFGGFDGINRLNDFYKVNMNSGKVKRISQHGSIPCPRYVYFIFYINSFIVHKYMGIKCSYLVDIMVMQDWMIYMNLILLQRHGIN